jgi:hypothetical protein
VRNPGGCYVSALCFEPRIGVQVLERMLRDATIGIFLRTVIVAVDRNGDRIASALGWQFDKRAGVRFRLRYLLDATETGDMLPLAKIPYVVGSESKSDTGEPHAAEKPNPDCVQSFTYPFAIERRNGENHRIAKPPEYEAIVKRQQFTLRLNYPVEYGWKGTVEYRMYGDDPPVPNNMSPRPFFSWRRLSIAAAGDCAHELAPAGLCCRIDSRSGSRRPCSCPAKCETHFRRVPLLDSG